MTAYSPSVKKNPPIPKMAVVMVIKNNAANPTINLIKVFI